jgi:hypothetical protein
MIAALGVANNDVTLTADRGKFNHTGVEALIYTSHHKTAVDIAAMISEPSFLAFLQQNLAAKGINEKFEVSKPAVLKRASAHLSAKTKVYKPEIRSQGSKVVVLGGVGVFLVLMTCLSCLAPSSASAVAVAPAIRQPYQYAGSEFD